MNPVQGRPPTVTSKRPGARGVHPKVRTRPLESAVHRPVLRPGRGRSFTIRGAVFLRSGQPRARPNVRAAPVRPGLPNSCPPHAERTVGRADAVGGWLAVPGWTRVHSGARRDDPGTVQVRRRGLGRCLPERSRAARGFLHGERDGLEHAHTSRGRGKRDAVDAGAGAARGMRSSHRREAGKPWWRCGRQGGVEGGRNPVAPPGVHSPTWRCDPVSVMTVRTADAGHAARSRAARDHLRGVASGGTQCRAPAVQPVVARHGEAGRPGGTTHPAQAGHR